jgi:type II secretory pathway pseudopilin PulG
MSKDNTWRVMSWTDFVVVLCIIMIGAAILFPVMATSRPRGGWLQATMNMKLAYTSLSLYTSDNNEAFPFAQSIKDEFAFALAPVKPAPTKLHRLSQSPNLPTALRSFVKSERTFYSDEAWEDFPKEKKERLGTSYIYNGPAAAWYGTLAETDDPAQLTIMYESYFMKPYPKDSSRICLASVSAEGGFLRKPVDDTLSAMKYETLMRRLRQDHAAILAKSSSKDSK